MKKNIFFIIILVCSICIFCLNPVESKTVQKRKTNVYSYKKNSNGIHYHKTYKATRYYNANKKRKK